MLPRASLRNPLTARKSELFPAPLAPNITTNSPESAWMSMPSRARKLP
jgi:hypothetical protein